MTRVALPSGFLACPIAHRALHGPGAPENSRAAMQAAIAHGFGIEIDLQLSADGVAMVFHDDKLDRLTAENGPVRARDAAELGRIDLDFTAEGIPTFAEILRLIDGRVPLLVELKDQSGMLGPSDGRLEAAASDDVSGYDGPLAFMSFSPDMVGHVAETAPERPRGLVTCAFRPHAWPTLPVEHLSALARIEAAEAVGASFISHQWTDLHSARVAELKADGRAILCWTIKSAAEEVQARQIADNITFEHYIPGVPA
ncbi:MAG: glycerophosphodiester phosphodiesterase family protein [Pseudomonadota bacterium]